MLLLAVALSLDSLIAGVAYGLKGIRVPARAIAVMAVISTLVLALSMGIGRGAGVLLPRALAQTIGALLLMGIGTYTLLKSWLARAPVNAGSDGRLAAIRLTSLGLVIEILRDPAAADVDRSGDLTVSEAVALGFAMAVDAFGVGTGVGVAMTGWLPWLLPPLVGLGAAGLLSIGYLAGTYGITSELRSRIAYLPGWILLSIGILRLACK